MVRRDGEEMVCSLQVQHVDERECEKRNQQQLWFGIDYWNSLFIIMMQNTILSILRCFACGINEVLKHDEEKRLFFSPSSTLSS